MPKPSLRENLLDAGFRLMWQTGYGATGVRDIVAAAGAPQGSFTNHFRSKEDFACEVLDRYFAYVGGLVSDALCDATLRPIDRLDVIHFSNCEAERVETDHRSDAPGKVASATGE